MKGNLGDGVALLPSRICNENSGNQGENKLGDALRVHNPP